MNTIAELFLQESERQKQIESYQPFIYFLNFCIYNFEHIHREVLLEDLKRLSVFEPYFNTNKEKLKSPEIFEHYIKLLDYIDEDKTIGNILHYTTIEKILNDSIFYKGLSFCIENNIHINNHTAEEFELFQINIIN